MSARSMVRSPHEVTNVLVCVAKGIMNGDLKKDIAIACGIQPSQVAYYFQMAVRRGIIQLNVPSNFRLANELKESLYLEDAVVLTAKHLNADERRAAIASQAAHHLCHRLRRIENPVVGISGGRYMFALAQELDIPQEVSSAQIVSLAEVAVYDETLSASANFIAGLIKMNNPHVGVYALSLPIPPDVSVNDREKVESFLREHAPDRAIEAYQRLFTVTDVYTSIGILDEQSTFWLELSEEQRWEIGKLIKENHVIGDCLYQLINSDGDIVDEESLWGHFSALPLIHLRRMVAEGKRVVVLAGVEKRKVVAAVLKGRFFNCLICDEETAEFLLNSESGFSSNA